MEGELWCTSSTVMLYLIQMCGQGGTPLSALLLGRAAEWADVDPLGGAPLFTLGCRAAAVQACRVCLAIRQEAAGTNRVIYSPSTLPQSAPRQARSCRRHKKETSTDKKGP